MSNIYKGYCLYQSSPTYASSVWDPYQYNKIYIIDRIQCRAARCSLCNYNRYSSVTLMQLQQRWETARLLLLHKALHNYTALHIPPYYKPSHTNTRANHRYSFINPSARTNFYKYSFFPNTIKHWNSLSSETTAQSPTEFYNLITVTN